MFSFLVARNKQVILQLHTSRCGLVVCTLTSESCLYAFALKLWLSSTFTTRLTALFSIFLSGFLRAWILRVYRDQDSFRGRHHVYVHDLKEDGSSL